MLRYADSATCYYINSLSLFLINHVYLIHIESGELLTTSKDFLLPRTLISRLAKGVLPPNTSIHRDALLAITKAATVFVSYLSSQYV